MTTGVVSYDSDLKRKAWMREGLLQGASQSFWAPYVGTTKDSIVFQAKNESAKAGHTVVFDYDGNLSGKAVKGKETAFGKGEQKKKFSDKLTVERYRLVVDNGDKFDGVDIGDLSINEHTQSRARLADLFVRFKDQALFDAGQGNLLPNTPGYENKVKPSHIIDGGATFDFGTLLDIEKTLKTSQGFTTGTIRRPLQPFMMQNGEPIWLFVIDSAMANKLRRDTAGYQTIMRSGDFRGNQNRNISGVIGKLGSLLIVEASQFFGFTAGSKFGWNMNDSEIEICGLRQYAGADPATALWTGQEGFDYASAELHSRGMLLGAGAIQMGMGLMPDYKFQESEDFGIKSESALEVWMEVKKTHIKAENEKYKQAKVSDIDYGVVAFDVKVA